MSVRLQKLRDRLSRRKLDAILISQPDNRRYLSGYSACDHDIQESSGLLLICRRGTPLLLTDSRFSLQAREQATAFEVKLYQHGLLALLTELLPALSIKRLGFESHYTLHSTAGKLRKCCQQTGTELVALIGLVEKMRQCKEKEELDLLQQSVLLNEEVFQEVFSQLRPGMTEIEVALMLENLMRQKGAERPSFDTIVASGPNGALPHATPSHRPLQQGEPIVIDMGLILHGYCSDMTRTVVLGQPSTKTTEIVRLVRKAQLAGMRAVRAGMTGKQVDQAARSIIKEAGYGSAFGHGLGHGVGLAVHEAPSLSPRSNRKLQKNMVVTVEPGIYLEDWGGVRLENMVVVEEGGCTILNKDTTQLDL